MTDPGKLPVSRDLVSSVRHGLLNPVHNILSLANLVLSGMEGEVNETVQENVRQIQAEALDLQAMLNGVLELTQVEHTAYERRPLDIWGVVRQACANSQALAQSRGKTIRLPEQPALPPGNVDGAAICRAAEILLATAIAFAEHKTLSLALHRDGAWVIVSIMEGRASAEKSLPVPWPEAWRQDGHGLDLLIATRIIERHGGTLWASQQPGHKGLTVSFSLPIVEQRDDAHLAD